MNPGEAYTTRELSKLFNITPKYILKRSTDEKWQSRPRTGRGGGHEWLLSFMPEATRIEVTTLAAQKAAELVKAEEQAVLPLALCNVVSPDAIDGNRRSKALRKADLLRLYIAHMKRYGKSIKERERFIGLYLDNTWPEILTVVGGKISWKTIETWKRTIRQTNDVAAIADKRGLAHRGKSILTERHRTIMLGLLLNPNAPHIAQCARKAQQRCRDEGLSVPSEATFRRFAQQFEEQSYNDFVLWRKGKKAWNDQCSLSIMRDWDLIGVGDVVIADGHVLNFETEDPETKKSKRMTLLLFYDAASNHPLGWEVMSTENTACISSAFRRACLVLGKFPRVIYLDNGRAFRAKYFEGTKNFEEAGFLGLYTQLGCEVVHAWPYHGQSKTIERFFGTMHEMEVFVPSYTGNDIDHKPARMKRGEAMHNSLYAKLGGRPLTLDETHRVISQWFDEYVNRPQPRSHLKGRSPREVFEQGVGPGVDASKLALLMMQKEIRTITKDGIRHRGKLFWHEALSSRRHAVVIRYDDLYAPHNVLVYTIQGDFICEARDREHHRIAYGVHPAAKALGTPEQQLELLDALELKKRQERLAGANMKTMLNSVVRPETQRMQAAIEANRALPAPEAPRIEKAMSKAEVAAVEQAKADARARREAEAKAGYTPCSQKRFRDELDRYEYLFGLVYRDGVTLTEEDSAWMAAFEARPNYARNMQRRFDSLRRLYEKQRRMAV